MTKVQRLRMAERIGWLGAICIVVAFALVSFAVIVPRSLAYQLLNCIGSAGLIWDGWVRRDWPPAVLNVVFFLIAVASLLYSTVAL